MVSKQDVSKVIRTLEKELEKTEKLYENNAEFSVYYGKIAGLTFAINEISKRLL